jgi:hypothetical protein
MAITDKIQEGVQQLPSALQAEVLDFVQFLPVKTTRGSQEDEEGLWSGWCLSLNFYISNISGISAQLRHDLAASLGARAGVQCFL